MTADSDTAAINERLGDQRGRRCLDVYQRPVGKFGCSRFGAGRP